MNHNDAKIIKIIKGAEIIIKGAEIATWLFHGFRKKSSHSHLKLIIGTRPHKKNSHIHVRYVCTNFERILLKH
jgi:hypothetical protein